MIQRNIVSKLIDFTKKFPIVSLTGPRQSGKTTLLRHVLPDYRYVSLENPDNRNFAIDDPNGFLKTYNEFVIFDEVQRVPELFSYIQTKVDEDKIMGQYILSGSQNFLLLSQISQTLAGRVAVLKLLPFSYAELQNSNLLSDNIAENIFKGTYPATYDRQLSSDEFYPSYLETYIQRDVRNLLDIKDLRSFQIFIKLCAGRIGQPLNLSSLANDCGISSPTAKAWISILESSFVVFTLSPYYKNFSKRLIKSPKLYFYDTGLACHLLNMTEAQQVETYYQRGSLFENAIISELLKNRFNQAKNQTLYFWQDSNKNEVDLLEEVADEINLFEMKYTMTITKGHLKNLQLFRNISEIEGENYLIYAGNTPQIRSEGKVESWKKITEL